jgi:hypothetical protein
LNQFKKNQLTSSSTAKEVSARTDLLQAVEFIADSWRRVSTKTVQISFAYCGFKHSNLEMPKMHYIGNYEEFSRIFNVIMKMKTVRTAAKHQKSSEDQDYTTERERAINQNARKFTAGLWLYFMQGGNECSPIYALETCAYFIHLHSIKRIWQGTLDQFLRH